MGYPEDVLAPDEQLILHRHPHWKMLFWPVVTLIVATALAGFAGGLAYRNIEGTGQTVVLALILAAWVGIVAWRFLGPLISWASTHFIITDRRLLIRQGVITHVGTDIPMSRISSVQFRHGLFDRMLGTGTLIIASSSDEPLEFDDIPRVQAVHSLLYHQVFEVDRHAGRRTYGAPDH
ncbi:PH domain-containing protein [Nocardia puris]|uniref:PH (Pleckstrin Homology) domain-containing protein n=1 Tax=Nocardia puris TaxID=208602 RepID=A0A366D6H6_9NOCA|nr:PH domain-containing protein [Nocardia puris]MBF6212331.1 PH domain-containing protein [Nocardia puris]MBF6366578.1 PH domain-containing protein [Nocardia puris]MBF6460920.1 PH domain-containing protein [Nocardia puris]RBO85565.1 PH (Pleckstrin Homology) domain-containing protein [Nocardia puris]